MHGIKVFSVHILDATTFFDNLKRMVETSTLHCMADLMVLVTRIKRQADVLHACRGQGIVSHVVCRRGNDPKMT